MNKKIKIRFSGQGGQGIVRASIIFGDAAIRDGYKVAQIQSYGPEQRGGRLKSDVIISADRSINFPIIDKADILVAMSQEAFDVYFPLITTKALVLINSNSVELPEEQGHEIVAIPATELALKLGKRIVANIIMIGVLTRLKTIVSSKSLIDSIKNLVPRKFVSINLEALDLGLSLLE
ncbi:MAG: 2-oxoacid:acceptor oxidoreductase family protein [Candidatus Helarchaeota archaeon]